MPDADPEGPRWLTPAEQEAWRSLVAVLLRLPGALERHLQRTAGLTHVEYLVLALLSEAPRRRLRLSHLAVQADTSLSRLSHLITRLERRGWVGREPDADDARATQAVLRDPGLEVLVAAAPHHVAQVRDLVLDGLDPEQVRALGAACDAILTQLGAAEGRRLAPRPAAGPPPEGEGEGTSNRRG